ncbi:right-handed parallel beta-helix repeat-containing protein, partial [Bacillus stratosphericus]
FNSDTNEDDVRAFAGILIDGQSNKTIADLSVKYTHPDFYRFGQSYFGKVNGIVVNDADNTLISKVEVSGANRAGVFFTSTHTLQPDPQGSQGRTYKARLIRGEVDETYENLPLGENNRIIDSNLHHNRVAGVLLAYQKNFIADNNVMSWNGHEKDGGTGYGIASMAGSYNYGITFRNNTTDHNYRKGLDVHDGDNIVIENNVSIGDRLYGIGVYNRQFTMDTVNVSNNTVIADPEFRLAQ